MTKPRFKHDCDQCQFLGRVGPYDCYRCAGVNGHTLIARRSNDPPDYSSLCDFGDKEQAAVRAYTGGMTDTQVTIIALFRLMPSLILNMVC